MTGTIDVASTVATVGAPTPPPSKVDDDLVSPGVAGFVITALLAIVVVLLIVDMTRRIRRVRYREQVRDEIAEEIAEARGAGQNPDD